MPRVCFYESCEYFDLFSGWCGGIDSDPCVLTRGEAAALVASCDLAEAHHETPLNNIM